jgi:hypothetical protein
MDEESAHDVAREDRDYWAGRYDLGPDENDEPDDL